MQPSFEARKKERAPQDDGGACCTKKTAAGIAADGHFSFNLQT
jgi:hypothetical protein